MSFKTFSRKERSELVSRYQHDMEQYNTLMNVEENPFVVMDDSRAEEHLRNAERVIEEYYEGLPRMPLSICPECDKPLVRTFDPIDFDGFWWRSDRYVEEPPTCPHFCVLTGTVQCLDSSKYTSTRPYVIPRLLELEGMTAVMGHVEMQNGCVTYPIAYFAPRRPPPQDLTANWGRKIYTYKTQLGEVLWREPNEAMDFDLKPWVQRQKIRWCIGNGESLAISKEEPDRFPYLDQ